MFKSQVKVKMMRRTPVLGRVVRQLALMGIVYRDTHRCSIWGRHPGIINMHVI